MNNISVMPNLRKKSKNVVKEDITNFIRLLRL